MWNLLSVAPGHFGQHECGCNERDRWLMLPLCPLYRCIACIVRINSTAQHDRLRIPRWPRLCLPGATTLTSAWGIVAWCDARWLTLGTCARNLVAAFLVGVELPWDAWRVQRNGLPQLTRNLEAYACPHPMLPHRRNGICGHLVATASASTLPNKRA